MQSMQDSFCHLIYDCPPSALLPYVGRIEQMSRLPFSESAASDVLYCAVLHCNSNYVRLAVNHCSRAPQAAT